ncbi:hypothetical protein JOC70_000727 [Clostridium pascui]|uniref:hypothetical protein n=1 Tax=Clostridium pascui TaxID=46609 RepID=UPI001957DA23|nr:hypothetical protein [Clostridium pascui]MBM7869258.1 hypothetical protein [Clostridium pascui]
MIKKAEKVKEVYNIKVTKGKVEDTGCCDSCENITRFSDEDDDFVANYDTTYIIYFKMTEMEITLCEDCLKRLKSKIDKALSE